MRRTRSLARACERGNAHWAGYPTPRIILSKLPAKKDRVSVVKTLWRNVPDDHRARCMDWTYNIPCIGLTRRSTFYWGLWQWHADGKPTSSRKTEDQSAKNFENAPRNNRVLKGALLQNAVNECRDCPTAEGPSKYRYILHSLRCRDTGKRAL